MTSQVELCAGLDRNIESPTTSGALEFVPADVIDVDIPKPDYSDSEDDGNAAITPPLKLTKEQLDLRRELQLTSKLGINVLHKKSELQKELDRRKERQQERELEEQKRQRRSSLDRRLEEQARKLSIAEQQSTVQTTTTTADDENKSEFLKVYSKMCKT
jgi:cell division protein ZapA (FtsZ GTPase activity inhibitor)